MFNNQFFSSTLSDESYNDFLKEVMEVDYTAFYRGTVVDNDDPMLMGRVRVRIPQIYGSESQRDQDIYVPSYAIPWATSAVMSGAGNNTGAYLIPNIGDTVFVTFENADPRLPIYFGGILTRNGTDKFIGTPDANGGKLYKASDIDFNTDITNKSQRVLYKSLKGATIIIDDKDEDESIKIIDQLGQFISLENVGSGNLNRDRSGGTESKARSGRIVIKDAYEDSIDLHNGEIHIKTPKLVIETDDFYQVGYNDQFPEEVEYADEILGGEEDPVIVDEYAWHFENDTDLPVAIGIVYDFENDDEFQSKSQFDFYRIIVPGESFTFTQTDTSIVNEDYYYLTCINSEYYGNYNIQNYWSGTTSHTLYLSDCLNNGNYYVRTEVDIDQLTSEEKEEIRTSGNLTITNNYTGEERQSSCGGSAGNNPTFDFGYDFLIYQNGSGVWEVTGFYPYTRNNIEGTNLPLPVGTYTFELTSDSGELDHTLGTRITGPTLYQNQWSFYRFPFAPKGTYYVNMFEDVSPLSTVNLNDVIGRMYVSGNDVEIQITNNSNNNITCMTYNVLDAEYEDDDFEYLSPKSKQYFGLYSEWNVLAPGQSETRILDLTQYPDFDINDIHDIYFGYFIVND